MKEDIFNALLLAGVFLVLFVVAELLYHKGKVKAPYTRKLVHFSTGFITMLFPLLLDSHWYVLALCASFFIILLTSMRLNVLPSINAVDRKTRGSLLFPIVVYGCFLMYQEHSLSVFYYIPILVLSVSDPLAEFFGKKFPKGIYTTFSHQKTLSGSSAFLFSAFIISTILMYIFEDFSNIKILFLSFAVALLTTIAEAFSHKGYDNLTIPASAVLVLYLFKELI